jgi:hypothetical protein
MVLAYICPIYAYFYLLLVPPQKKQKNKKTNMAEDLAFAKQKLANNVSPFNVDSLPLDRNDSIWADIRKEYGLTLPELSALKNARCQQGAKKRIPNLKIK